MGVLFVSLSTAPQLLKPIVQYVVVVVPASYHSQKLQIAPSRGNASNGFGLEHNFRRPLCRRSGAEWSLPRNGSPAKRCEESPGKHRERQAFYLAIVS